MLKKEIPMQSSYFKYLKILWAPVSIGVTAFCEIIKFSPLKNWLDFPASAEQNAKLK
jgi:hypothetical protein